MLISTRWLARHVDLDGLTPEQVADSLTLATAEVEGLSAFAPHLADVLVGFVQTCEPHPDADKLSVCTVDVGGEEPLQIVCGAPNIAAGQKVAVATVGTVLPGDFKIKKAKIRGVASQGMICSAQELELGDDHDGIWVLDEDAAVGLGVAEALDLTDTVIEIDNKSLTHRPDLWGHRGIAAELAAIHRRELLPLDLSLPACGDGPAFPVRIDAPACSRYIALGVDGVRQGQSPDWLRFLLLAVGQRPLDLLVDLSNFVMLDLGQPNHLFDRGRLSGEGIVVRMAREGERTTTLDGEERALSQEDLLICSGEEPVALAGIMGGEGSKVLPGTSDLLLEVAHFDPVSTRRSAIRLGMRSDASARFEKGLDPTLPLAAAAHLVRTLASIQPDISLPAPATDVGTWSDPACEIELRGERVRRLLGLSLSDEEIADSLRRLHFGVREGGGVLQVSVPSGRAGKDVALEEDLVEEVGRIVGYARIPVRSVTAEIAPPPRDDRRTLVRGIQDRLSGGARFHEVLNYSFLSDESLAALGLDDRPHVELRNPVCEGERNVRRSVLPGLLGLLERNRRRREEVRLFEIGKGYLPERPSERGEPLEIHEVGLVWAAVPCAAGARFDAGCFAGLQGVLEDLLGSVGFDAPTWEVAGDSSPPAWAHPGRTLFAVLPDAAGVPRPVGVLAALEPGLHRTLGLEGELATEVAAARISLDLLLDSAPRAAGYRPIPRFPSTKIDVALAVGREVGVGDCVAAIERCGKGLVVSCELFDVFSGESVGAGRRSLAFHVVLASPERTLGEADGRKFLRRVERAALDLGGELRSE